MSYNLATQTAAVFRTYGSSSRKHLRNGSHKYSVILSTRIQPMVRTAKARINGFESSQSYGKKGKVHIFFVNFQWSKFRENNKKWQLDSNCINKHISATRQEISIKTNSNYFQTIHYIHTKWEPKSNFHIQTKLIKLMDQNIHKTGNMNEYNVESTFCQIYAGNRWIGQMKVNYWIIKPWMSWYRNMIFMYDGCWMNKTLIIWCSPWIPMLAKRVNATQQAWNDEVHIANVGPRVTTAFDIILLCSAHRNIYQ